MKVEIGRDMRGRWHCIPTGLALMVLGLAGRHTFIEMLIPDSAGCGCGICALGLFLKEKAFG